MKKIAYQLLAASLFAVVLVPMAAYAQPTNRLNVEIPYQFRVGNDLLPAGKYVIEPVDAFDPNVLVFRDVNNNAVAIVSALPAERLTHPAKSSLVFSKVGNQEVLTKIWLGGQKEGFQILENGSKSVAMASNSHAARNSAPAKRNGM